MTNHTLTRASLQGCPLFRRKPDVFGNCLNLPSFVEGKLRYFNNTSYSWSKIGAAGHVRKEMIASTVTLKNIENWWSMQHIFVLVHVNNIWSLVAHDCIIGLHLPKEKVLQENILILRGKEDHKVAKPWTSATQIPGLTVTYQMRILILFLKLMM